MGVNLGSNRAACWGAALMLCACTGGGGAPPAPIEDFDGEAPRFDGGPRGDGGRDGSTEAGGEDGGAELGPSIELLEPEADSVIVGSTVSARCHVERNPDGEPVDPSSVEVALYAGEETTAFATQVAASTSEANVFRAELSLANAPHGAVRVECSAEDISQQKLRGAQSVSTAVDRGPRISFLNLVEGGFSPADVNNGEDFRVRFKVEPQPLSDDDLGAAIDGFTIAVNGKEVGGVEESATEEYAYSFGLDFGDKAVFTVVPNTLTVRVDARNAREPAGTATKSLSVGVDGEGPEIVVMAPTGAGGAEPIVSGKVDVVLLITDDLAGVDPDSVEMKIGPKTYPVDAAGNGRFVSTFEVGEFPDTADLTLNFTARDVIGNSTTASQGVRIDDQPPWVSLTPELTREVTGKAPSPVLCSGPFDPLGDDAPNDGEKVFKAVRLRALAWDRARQVSGQGILHYAMVDQTSVDIVVQHDPDIPLLINSMGVAGGPCDAVNLQPAAGAPVVIELDAIPPAGASPLGVDLSVDPDVSAWCDPKTGTAPSQLCPTSEMTRVIKHSVPGGFPVIYGINVQTSICTGDYYSNPKPGPLCMVAKARDNAGNVAFSAPIKLCVEYADGEDGDPVDGIDALVSCPDGVLDDVECTDGCVLPTGFGPGAPDRMPRVVRAD